MIYPSQREKNLAIYDHSFASSKNKINKISLKNKAAEEEATPDLPISTLAPIKWVIFTIKK